AVLTVSYKLRQFFDIRVRAGYIAAAGRADRARPINGVQPIFASRRNRQCSRFLPAVQFQRSSRGEIGAMLGFTFFVCSNHMISVLDDFARYGFLTALQVDRKSTRLNSSHVASSYAVFSLK